MISLGSFLLFWCVIWAKVYGTLTESEEKKQLQFLQKSLQIPVPIPQLNPTDRILFIGNMNGFYGDIFAHGFIDLFRRQLSASPDLNTVTVMHTLLPDGGQDHQEFYEQHILPQTGSHIDDDELFITNLYQPTKIIYLIGNELLFHNTDSTHSPEALDELVKHIEKSCVHLALHIHEQYPELQGEPIILAPLFLHGEQHNAENEYDDHWEVLQGKLQQTSRFHQYAFLDLTSPLWKAIECWNVDNQAQGLFTFDGHTLNARGHQVLANALTNAFGLTSSSSSSSSSKLVYEGGNAYTMIWEEAECPATALKQLAGPGKKRRGAGRGEEESAGDEESRRRLLSSTLQSQRGIYEKLQRFQALPDFLPHSH